MKFDMHCHTKEGSMDGKVPIEDFIGELIRKGFDGMLVSDHNSYNGYRKWKRTIKDKEIQRFCGIEGNRIRHHRCRTYSCDHAGDDQIKNIGTAGSSRTDPD